MITILYFFFFLFFFSLKNIFGWISVDTPLPSPLGSASTKLTFVFFCFFFFVCGRC